MAKEKLVRTNPFVVAHNCYDRHYGNREDVVTDLLVSQITLDFEVGLELMRFMTGVDLPADTAVYVKAQPGEISATGDNPDILLTAPEARLALFIEVKVDSGQSAKAGDERTQLRRYLDQIEILNQQGRTLLAYLVRDAASSIDPTVAASPLFVSPKNRSSFTWQDVHDVVHAVADRKVKHSVAHRVNAAFLEFLERSGLASGHVVAPWAGLLDPTDIEDSRKLRLAFSDLLRRSLLGWLEPMGIRDGTEANLSFKYLHDLWLRPPREGPLSTATGVTWLVVKPSSGHHRPRPSQLVPPCLEIRIQFNETGGANAEQIADTASACLPEGAEFKYFPKSRRCAWWIELNRLLAGGTGEFDIREAVHLVLAPFVSG